MTILIPHGFEANYTVGFVRGLRCNNVPLCVVTDDVIHPRLAGAGVEAVNLRGSVEEGRNPLIKAGNLLRYYVQLVWLLLRRRGVVVHFTGIFRNAFILFEGFVLQAAFRLLSRRYVYTAHNVLPHNKQNSRLYRFLYRRIYRLPHSIVVHTSRAREQLIEEFGVPAAKVTVMSIGLNDEVPLTDLSRAEARKRLGLAPLQPAALFFGKIDEYKGLDLLIMAFERVQEHAPASRLLIAGSFRNQACRAKIMAQLEMASCRGQILFQEGHVSNEEIEAWFKAADVVVLPYRNIYQSGILFLALRFGIPVIASDVGSISEFVDAESGMLVPPDDVAALARALEAFFSERQHYKSGDISDRAALYRWENVCGAVTPIYG